MSDPSATALRSPAPVVNPTLSADDWALLLTLSLLWGGSFFFVGVAVRELPPLTIVLARVGLAALVLWAWVYGTGGRMPHAPRRWGEFLVMGALNGLIPYGLIVWGQTHIDSGVAAILNGTTPLFSVLLVPLFTRDERLTAGRLLGVLLGLAGLAVLTGTEALHALLAWRALDMRTLGKLAVVGGALSYACAAIYGRRLRDLPVRVAAAGSITGTALLVLPLALLLEQPWRYAPGAGTWAALAGLALLSTALAYGIYFRLLARAGATNLLLVTLLIPVSALALGVAFLGERPGWHALAGLALIGAGILAVDGRVARWVRGR